MNAAEIARILDMLGERLGPTGQYVFALAVRQQFIEGVMAAAVLALILGLAVLAQALWLKNCFEYDRKADERDRFGATGIVVTSLAGWMIPFACLLAGLPYAVGKLLNPEYAAIRDLLDQIR